MGISRRSFLRRTAAGVAITAITPSALFAAGEKSKQTSIPQFKPEKFDVVVVGAGAAGVPAAIAAAREGARVALLEEDLLPGGATVDMYVTYLCGGPKVGIFQDMIQRLNANHTFAGVPSPSFGINGSGDSHWYHPTSFLQVIIEMLNEYSNITLMCGANVVDVILGTRGNRNLVKGVRVFRNGGMQDIEASVTIDATGIGLVSELAGCEVMYGTDSKRDFNENIGLEVGNDKVQPCTWMFISQKLKKGAGLPVAKLKGGIIEDEYGWVPRKDDPTGPWTKRDSNIYLHWGAGVYCKDVRDPLILAASQKECWEKMKPEVVALREAGFQVHLAPKIGIRECRRIKGEHVLTMNDLQQGLMPDDKIADARYYIDAWGMKLTKEQKQVPPYGIPYRALIPLGVDGLLTAGRIISGTHLAASSYRVQPICASIGEAAGAAAAITAMNKTSVRDIDVKSLISKLDGYGLFSGLKKK
jgi:hypothetical protein